MRTERVDTDPQTWLVVLDAGDELGACLADFAKQEGVQGASLSAVGAFSSVELLWFDGESRSYRTSVRLDEQVELVSLLGDIASKDGEPAVHAHIGVARHDGTMHGGHLKSAIVRPTCEIVVRESDERWRKQLDAESGLALIRPGSAS